MIEYDCQETTVIADSILKYIDREIVPIEAANKRMLDNERFLYDEDGRYCGELLELRRRIRMRSAELGFYNLFGSSELGGSGLGAQASLQIQEAINHHCGPERKLIQTVVIPSPFTNGLSPLLRSLRPETLKLYKKDISSGFKTLCFALSEPDAGSDVMAMKTTARREGEYWILNGTKQWITNSPHADYAMVFAVTNPELVQKRKGGITGFFIDTKSPGFTVPSVIPMMGHLGSETGIVTLTSLRVHESHLIGEVDLGLQVAIKGISVGRLGMAGTCIGLARWALDLSIAYTQVRKTFGKKIAEHQAIQMKVADCAIDIYAAKSMAQRCAASIDGGNDSIKEISMTKAFCTEMLNRVIDQCIQIHGAIGLTNEIKLEKAYRFARILKIPDGTAEIQRRTIATRMLAGDLIL